jgi:hypothetical protein
MHSIDGGSRAGAAAGGAGRRTAAPIVTVDVVTLSGSPMSHVFGHDADPCGKICPSASAISRATAV